MNKVYTLEVDDELPEKVERNGVLLADGFHGGEEEFNLGLDFRREVRRDGRVSGDGSGGGGGVLGLEDADRAGDVEGEGNEGTPLQEEQRFENLVESSRCGGVIRAGVAEHDGQLT